LKDLQLPLNCLAPYLYGSFELLLTGSLRVLRKIIIPIFRKVVKLLSGHGIGRFYLIKIPYYFLLSRLKNTSQVAEVQGHKMFLDPTDTLELSIWGTYEPPVTELFKKEIKRGDVVLDIGAHIGYYTLILAKLVGENGRVYAFEPDPTNFNLLEKNVKANSYKNVSLVQKAVSNKTGRTNEYLGEGDSGDHRIYDPHDGRKSIEIEAIRLDDYFKSYGGKIDFIKMHVQGAEALVIEGMPQLLQQNQNVKIITHFWPMGLRKCGFKPEEYLKILIGYGFKIYLINENKIEPIAINELMQLCTEEDFKNLVCLRREASGYIQNTF